MNRNSRQFAFASARSGFTLVETIATMVIIATVGSLTSAIVLRATDSYRFAGLGAQIHADLTSALDPIERTLRAIPRREGEIAPDIVSVAPAALRWNAQHGEASLVLNNGQLLFNPDGAGATPILNNIADLTIQTFDESNSLLAASLSSASTNSIRRIAVTVTIDREGVQETLRTKVFLRCMMQGVTE